MLKRKNKKQKSAIVGHFKKLSLLAFLFLGAAFLPSIFQSIQSYLQADIIAEGTVSETPPVETPVESVPGEQTQVSPPMPDSTPSEAEDAPLKEEMPSDNSPVPEFDMPADQHSETSNSDGVAAEESVTETPEMPDESLPDDSAESEIAPSVSTENNESPFEEANPKGTGEIDPESENEVPDQLNNSGSDSGSFESLQQDSAVLMKKNFSSGEGKGLQMIPIDVCTAEIQSRFSWDINDLKSWRAIQEEAEKGNGQIYYQFSLDNGVQWIYFNGEQWSLADQPGAFNSIDVVNSNLNQWPVSQSQILFKALFINDCTEKMELLSLKLKYEIELQKKENINVDEPPEKSPQDLNQIEENTFTFNLISLL